MSGNGRPRSLVLVTVDCLRADHAGFMGYAQPTTPFLDSLAKESLVADAIVAGAPTYYSFPAIMTSRMPLALGRDVVGLAPGEPSLATVLAYCGYRTAAFNAGNVYLSSRSGYEQGFEVFSDFLDADIVGADGPRASRKSQIAWYSRLNRGLERVSRRFRPAGAVYDELYFQYCQSLASRSKNDMDQLRRVPAADVLVNQALTWMQSVAGQPFFLWLHFMDAHHPYYPPLEALSKMGRDDIDANRARYLNCFWDRADVDARRLLRHREDVVALYDAGIRWVDMQLARLVDGLLKLGTWAETALVVTADHGEEFLEHGGRYHAPVKLTEEIIRVPLLMRVPGDHACAVNGSPFSLVHLAPTLLEALGLPASEEFDGRSHWTDLRTGYLDGTAAVVEVVDGCTNPLRTQDRLGPRLLAIRDSRYKLIFQFRDGREELFDLQSAPAEHSPLPQDEARSERRRLLEVAKEHLSQSTKPAQIALRMRARMQELRRGWEKEQLPDRRAAIVAHTGT
ncbi:MAG TPA: sulfatase-like hydrolase/transferase [Terriglobales bacterium]|nr:sulfatase-like hydrolase/transferase [Terriglobales bacterium]